MSSLFEFEDVEPPRINCQKWIPHKEDYNKDVGLLGVDGRDGSKVAVFPRRRRDGSDGQKSTFYRKGDGYALSTWVLDLLDAYSVPTLYVAVRDEGRLLEFDRVQYEDGQAFEFEGDPQRCVEEDLAIREWSRAESDVQVPAGLDRISPDV